MTTSLAIAIVVFFVVLIYTALRLYTGRSAREYLPTRRRRRGP